MTIAPFFAKVPRYIYAVVSEAMWVELAFLGHRFAGSHHIASVVFYSLIPVAIIGAIHFYTTLVDVLSEFRIGLYHL